MATTNGKKRKRGNSFVWKNVVVAVIAVALIVVLARLVQIFALPRSGEQVSSVLPGAIIALTEEQRAQNQLGNLTTNALLTQAAQNAANDMATKGYFAHISPDGTTPWDWLIQAGYHYQYAGQNLAVNFDDSQQLVNAWMASPTHRANMLDPHYTQIGVGMATGTYQGQEAVFVVQFFASPQQQSSR